MKASFIKIEDRRYKLPDISYDKFVELGKWEGASDMAYAKYLRDNDMHEIDSFNEETLAEAVLIFINHDGDEFYFKSTSSPENKE